MATPALLTSTSTRPDAEAALASSSEVTSRRTGLSLACAPAELTSVSNSSVRRAHARTSPAPASAHASASARPRPRFAPVIKILFPSISISVLRQMNLHPPTNQSPFPSSDESISVAVLRRIERGPVRDRQPLARRARVAAPHKCVERRADETPHNRQFEARQRVLSDTLGEALLGERARVLRDLHEDERAHRQNREHGSRAL